MFSTQHGPLGHLRESGRLRGRPLSVRSQPDGLPLE